ncbi:Siderophore iron transporter mirB 1 [Colletotrichum chlorophyti]|uniref:Siderophore iron transporter mirB 1 n=1 Tax=Colletotrichum chlorophyti TaxID=708187 RepID=A0A1Q8RUC0_9PEZI|nr:Siderophore iron transporter mirB 1 [Colletotrichum chlorophyti]
MSGVQHEQPLSFAPRIEGTGEKSEVVVTRTSRDHEAHPVFDSEKSVSSNAQAGVQNTEAITSTWTTTSLVVAYVLIWITYFVVLMQQRALATLNPFVTSAFAQHSLTPTVAVISSIIGGVFKLTLAKILDVLGRPQVYLLSTILAALGLGMVAACNNVELYAAAQVFYTVGQNALGYILGVFVADTPSLRNRGLMFAFSSSPTLITTWLSGPISEEYLAGPGWRWAFGTFSIIVPVVAFPLFVLFVRSLDRAKELNVVPKRESQKTVWRSFVHYCREFDAVGLLSVSAGLALFLLPFNIASMQERGWRAPLIICLLVFGVVLIIAFTLWERFFAPVSFIPYALLSGRTVLRRLRPFGPSFLLVVNNLTITQASYVANVYSLGSTLFAIFAGWLVRHTGHYKNVCLWFSIPLNILGMGLMIHFRQPENDIGFVIMCQVLISVAGGIILVCVQIAAMAVASHQHVAVVLAAMSMFSEIGGAIGLTLAAIFWQNVFPDRLLEYLPAEEVSNLVAIHADLSTQLTCPVGSAARTAIHYAYGDALKMILITGTVVWAIGFVATFVWKDVNVKEVEQVRGHVV